MAERRRGIVYLVGAGPGRPRPATRRGAEVLAPGRRRRLRPPGQPPPARPRPGRRPSGSSPARRPGTARCRRRRSTPCWSSTPGRAGGSSGSRGATRSSSAGGPRRPSTCTPRGVPFRVVPGVTAGVGVTAYAGLPITHRDAASAVAFVTGHDDPEAAERLAARLAGPGPVPRHAGRLHGRDASSRRSAGLLIREGKPAATPAALVQSGHPGRASATVVGDARRPARPGRRGRARPAGPAGRRRRRRPPAGPDLVRGAAPVRPADRRDPPGRRGRPLGRRRSRPWGPRSWSAPTVAILPLDDFGPLDRGDRPARRRSTGWSSPRPTASATSSTGSSRRGRDLRALGHLKLAAIGPATAEALAGYRLRADLVPDSFRSEALAEALRRSGRRPPRPAGPGRSGPGRPQGRARAGRPRRAGRRLPQRRRRGAARPGSSSGSTAGSVDWITLTSSAIAERLHALLPETARHRIGREIRLASLSPVTSATADAAGLAGRRRGRTYTWDGLVAGDRRHASPLDRAEASDARGGPASVRSRARSQAPARGRRGRRG